MKVLYDIFAYLTTLLLPVGAFFSPRLRRLATGRRGLFDGLQNFKQGQVGRLIWFHAASLGEYELSKPVIAQLKQHLPEDVVVVSFFSPSGYDQAVKKKQDHVDFITYLPFDTPAQARRFLDVLQPSMAFFAKYDLWANHILETKKRSILLFLFSASLRADQVYFRPYGGFFKNLLFSFDFIFCQNQKTQQLLISAGYDRTLVTGDTRFDRVNAIASSPKKFPELAFFGHQSKIVVAGSVWEEDMSLLIPIINQTNDYSWIIAPHDINPSHISDWQSKIHAPSLKYSEKRSSPTPKVLFIDNIGMLSSLYSLAHIAYVGGAFGKGLHNILEPLAFGIPVVFGQVKRASKFPEATVSIDYGCGYSIGDVSSLAQVLAQLSDESVYTDACGAANRLVEDNTGSAKKIVNTVLTQINQT